MQDYQVRTLKMCYFGCRYHAPRDGNGNFYQRPCPARMLTYRIRQAGFWASERRGRVLTDAPTDMLRPLYKEVKRKTQRR